MINAFRKRIALPKLVSLFVFLFNKIAKVVILPELAFFLLNSYCLESKEVIWSTFSS
jgi:hypothetical protein